MPLYQAIYKKYKGRLSPGNAAREAEMEALGVLQNKKGEHGKVFNAPLNRRISERIDLCCPLVYLSTRSL